MKKILITLLFCFCQGAASAGNTPEIMVPEETGDFEGDIEEASARIRRLMSNDRVSGQAVRMAEHIAARDTASAQKVLDRLRGEHPELKDDCALRMGQSLIYFWQGDYGKAYEQIDAVVRQIERVFPGGVKPGNTDASETENIAEAYFTRSSIARQLGFPSKAVSDIDKAFVLSPRPHMPLNKCRALMLMGKYEEAAAALDTAYRMDPAVTRSGDRERICGEFSKRDIKSASCAAKDI